MVQRVAFTVGVTGQDGAFLAELLLGKRRLVRGIKSRLSPFNTGRMGHPYNDRQSDNFRFAMHRGDLSAKQPRSSSREAHQA